MAIFKVEIKIFFLVRGCTRVIIQDPKIGKQKTKIAKAISSAFNAFHPLDKEYSQS